ncbi:MAG: hypothetical protein CVU56_08615 [Deltaproteobacteria bacterium HGW-Deltaproteobacteria-14]|jgi:hypothetical protein|nr:MAG: hypothetical protein CVU56_08615 [Deltaproteobacteria bacterium HGW-Deltaproteobacteria-14]
MRSSITALTALLALGLGGAYIPLARAAEAPPKESSCTDGVDDDGDTVTDCADADCYADPACQPDGAPENTDGRCSDWIDNDRDGHLDCDDADCDGPGITVCKGSWDKQQAATGGGGSAAGLPTIPDGASFEDLLGKMGDIDGERNDQDCADGVDNDNDGATDCADFGCRFDPNVLVCREAPSVRFSVVSFIESNYDFGTEQPDVFFKTLQLRAFGPMPFIQDSFFLLSARFEKTPRLTFAMFQVPIGGGNYLNINSGGGGLSSGPIRSASKQLLIEQPFYLYSAFEQGSGAAVEVGGPIAKDGSLNYRAYVAGGAGRFSGNVGGRYFTYDNTNFTYSVGAQLGINAIGHISRWDSPLLYVPSPTALGFQIGAKYDQRAQERYPAFNLQAVYKSGPFIGIVEGYLKRELEFESWQGAYNVQVGILAVNKTLLLAADFGQYLASSMKNPPAVAETDIRRQDDQLQWRVAVHWYFWRNIGVLSLLYDDHLTTDNATGEDTHDRILRLIAQYRF